MRYFLSSSAAFDAFRAVIVDMLALPSGTADEPWPVGITHLALAPHEYNDERFAPIITNAIAQGQVEEITEMEYRSHFDNLESTE